MSSNSQKSIHRYFGQWGAPYIGALYFAGLLLLPVSNSIGQVPLYSGAILSFYLLWIEKQKVRRDDLCWLCGFAAIILISLIYSVRPEMGVEKVNRLILFTIPLSIPLVSMRGRTRKEVVQILSLGLCLGASLLGVFDIVRVTVELCQGVRFADVGNMTDPQFYMVSLILLTGMIFDHRKVADLPRWLIIAVLFLLIAGLVLHCKRGVWFATGAGVFIVLLARRRWLPITIVSVAAILIAMTPPIYHRLNDLRNIFDKDRGDRVVLWADVAPRILPKYPLGMGYNASLHEDLANHTDNYLQPAIRHMHNNILQIRLELGWHGVLFWSAWMSAVLIRLLYFLLERQGGADVRAVGWAVFAALIALQLNGLVESNFGDSEILILFLLLFGFSSSLMAEESPQAS